MGVGVTVMNLTYMEVFDFKSGEKCAAKFFSLQPFFGYIMEEFEWYRKLQIIVSTMDRCNCPLSEDQRDILAGVLASLEIPQEK
jgi:hypothetical protein